jgi:hypothetical protein
VGERFRYRQQGIAFLRALPTGASAAGLGFRAIEPSAAREFREGLAAFQQGALIAANPPAFWSLERIRPALLAEMKGACRPGGDLPAVIKVMTQSTLPYWSEENGRVHYRYEIDVKSPHYKSEGVVTLVTKAPATGGSPQTWQVEGIELARGRVVREEPKGGNPGNPMSRPKPPSPRR